MGFLSALAGAAVGCVSAILGSSSSGGGGGSSYSRSVQVIEDKSKVEVARLENERVGLIKDAQLEIIEAQKQAQILVEEAKAKGFYAVAQTLVELQKQMNEVAAKRLEIIEFASVPVLKDIDRFYEDVKKRIDAENDLYNKEKLPLLLNTLNSFDKESGAYQLYFKRIDADIAQHADFIRQQMDAVTQRQHAVIEGFIDNKKRLLEQTGEISNRMLEEALQKQLALQKDSRLALENKVAELEEKKQALLAEKPKELPAKE